MKRTAIGAALAALALAMTCARARETPPPVGVARPFTLPARQDIRLPNGMQATLIPFGNVPKVTLILTLRTGTAAEGVKPGVATLATELLREGAGRRDADAIARAAAEMGGALDVSAGADELSIGIDVLGDRATDALALIADVVQHPALPERELARLKADLARQNAITRSQAQSVAGEAFEHLLWGDHPYGRGLASDAEIAAVRIDDVRGFVAREFGAGRAHLYVAGRFDAPALQRALRRHFGTWAEGAPLVTTHATALGERRVQLIDRPGAPQTTLLLGLPVPPVATPGFMKLSVTNALLGGSLLSRLDRNLREDKGWTYGVSTHITPYAGGDSIWALAADVNAPDTAAAITEIFAELERLRHEAPPVDELRATQNFRAGNFVIGASGRGGLLAQLAFCDLHALPADWLTEYGPHVQAVTPEEVRVAAERYLDPAAMTLVVVGDLAKLKSGIMALPALKGAQFLP